MKHVDWSRNSNIYEVNIRQFTEEGTFNAFLKHLPRLRDMGVDILWIMPVQPIGKHNRKGSLGSYYSISDYTAINPEFGSLDDFKRLVDETHKLGMKVLLDWVANHTAWDNVWTVSNPEYYRQNELGQFVSPWDWTDVIALDYTNAEMRQRMIEAMEYWLVETGLDGFRCDMAGMVPVDFWNEAKDALEKIKPIFMLAEDEAVVSLLEHAFDMNFTWEMHHLMNQVAKGENKASDIWQKYREYTERYPADAYRMYFTSNHDEDSHSGTAAERMGKGASAFAVLTYLLPGMPLIYTGQETGTAKRLAFFEKDMIDWSDIAMEGFYRTLNRTKKENEALWNGPFGGDMVDLSKGNNDRMFAIKRETENNIIIGMLNLSNNEQLLKMENDMFGGTWRDVFTDDKYYPGLGFTFELAPWSYLLLVKEH